MVHREHQQQLHSEHESPPLRQEADSLVTSEAVRPSFKANRVLVQELDSDDMEEEQEQANEEGNPVQLLWNQLKSLADLLAELREV